MKEKEDANHVARILGKKPSFMGYMHEDEFRRQFTRFLI
jgi:hypothetical protein